MYAERSVLLLSLAALTVLVLRRLSPAAKHAIWLTTLIALLLLPLLALLPLPNALTGLALSFSPEVFSGEAKPAIEAPLFAWRIVYLLGVAFLSLRLLVAHFAVRRFLRATSPAPQFARFAAKVRVVTHPTTRSPLTVGIFRATIVMPQTALSWSESFLKAVFSHELAHARRRDCATQLVAQIARAAYWFNPLVWLAERQMRLERERACDEAALSTGIKGSDFAESLLALATMARPLSLAASAQDGLGRRIEALVSPKRHCSAGIARLTLFLFAATAAFIACGKRSLPAAADKTVANPPAAVVPANVLASIPAGEMSPDLIRNVIHQNSDAIKGCYEAESIKSPNLEGKIVLHFNIMPDGTVSDVTTESDMASPPVENCIAHKIGALVFPKPTGGMVLVNYPFVFSQHGPPKSDPKP